MPDKEECLGWIGSNAIFSGHTKDLSWGGNCDVSVLFLCQNSKKVVSIIHKLPVNWTTKKIVANNNDDDVGGSDGNQNNDGEGEN